MNRPLSVVFLLLAFGLLLGPACDEKFEITKSPDLVTDPQLREEAEGVWTSSLFFDRQTLNRSQTKVVEIRNNGEAALSIFKIQIEGFEDCDRLQGRAECEAECAAEDDACLSTCEFSFRPGSRFEAPLDEQCEYSIDAGPQYASRDTPYVLEPERFADFDVVYRATKPSDPSSATLVIESSDRDKPSVRIALDVVAASPRINVSPSTVVFQPPCEGTTCLAPLSLINQGSGDLTIKSFTVRRLNPAPRDPMTNDPIEEFILDPSLLLPEAPFTIEPSRSESFDVQYRPADEGVDSAELIIESDDPQTPEFVIFMTSGEASSELVVQPNPIILNLMQGAGQTSTQINFANTGLKKLFVDKAFLEQTGDEFELPNCINDAAGCYINFQLLPADSRAVELIYTPRSGMPDDATLVVQTDADNVEGDLRIPILASGANVAALSFDPISINLSNVAPGSSGAETVTLTNTGGLPLEISRIGLSGEGDGDPLTDAEFSITSGGETLTLAPSATHEVEVTLTRGAEDTNLRIGSIIIVSNAATSPDRVYITSTPPRN